MARKGKYAEWLTEENLLRLEAWKRDGLTHEEIAHNMGINPATLYDWCNKFNEINEALKKGKEVADILVENALFKRALGYEYEEVTTEIKKIPYKDKNGKERTREEKHVKKVTKMVVPDVTAQIFWLKNRKSAVWRDRRDIEANVVEDLSVLEDMLK